MDQQQIIADFFDKEIRPEKIFHLGTQCLLDYLADDVRDALTDSDDAWSAMCVDCPDQDVLDDMDELALYVRERGLNGFLVQFATPIPRDFTEGGFSFSWGMYTTKWIYANTYDSTCEKAIEWRDQYIADKRSAALSPSSS